MNELLGNRNKNTFSNFKNVAMAMAMEMTTFFTLHLYITDQF